MAIAMAATSIVLTLVMGFLIFLELNKLNKQVLEIEKHIHHLNNEVNKLKQQAKKKYYANQKQVIKG